MVPWKKERAWHHSVLLACCWQPYETGNRHPAGRPTQRMFRNPGRQGNSTHGRCRCCRCYRCCSCSCCCCCSCSCSSRKPSRKSSELHGGPWLNAAVTSDKLQCSSDALPLPAAGVGGYFFGGYFYASLYISCDGRGCLFSLEMFLAIPTRPAYFPRFSEVSRSTTGCKHRQHDADTLTCHLSLRNWFWMVLVVLPGKGKVALF